MFYVMMLLSTFNLWLYGVIHMVKGHSDTERVIINCLFTVNINPHFMFQAVKTLP